MFRYTSEKESEMVFFPFIRLIETVSLMVYAHNLQYIIVNIHIFQM